MSETPPVPPSADPSPTASLQGNPPDRAPNEGLVMDMLGREYDNFNQSSFHSDGLRNQIIEFYLILVGAAATAIVGIAQLEAKNSPTSTAFGDRALWPFSAIALFIGLIGVLMLPIFVRLRRVVLECLAGTVLIKAYAEQNLVSAKDKLFASALLWDAHTLPLDESYFTASFVLVFVVMVLSSVMVGLSVFLRLYEQLLAQSQDVYPAELWSLVFGMGMLTLQVLVYRIWLWNEIRNFIQNDRLREKWRELGLTTKIRRPALVIPLLGALLIFGLPTLYLYAHAIAWLDAGRMWQLLTMGI